MERRAITLRVDSRLGNVALLTAAVEAISVELGLCAEDAQAVQLSTVEAVNNAIVHAHNGPIEVTLTNGGATLSIDVRDQGEPIPAGLLERAARRAEGPADETLSDSGRGLVIIHRLMTEVRYATYGRDNTLTMTLRLRPHPDGTVRAHPAS